MTAAATMAGIQKKGPGVSPKAFLQGVAFFALLYAVGAAWLWQSYPGTLEKQQGKLASLTAVIERPVVAVASAVEDITAEAENQELAETALDAIDADETAAQNTAQEAVAEDATAGHPAPPADTVYVPAPGETVPAPMDRHAEATTPNVNADAQHHEAVPAPAASGGALPPVPIEGLFETVQEGRIPVIRNKDKMTPFAAYKRPFDRNLLAGGKPVVSLAVVDAGLSNVVSQDMITALPPEVSFAISPYVGTADFWVNAARARGHEVWMTLPVESLDYPQDDNGPYSMMIGIPERQNIDRLTWVLTRAVGYAGVIASHKPAFLQSLNDMRPIVAAIYSRGLGFIDTSPTPSDTIESMALGQSAPYAAADVWIDEHATPEGIAAALAELEKIAKERGSAVGLMRVLPVSKQETLRWIATLPGKGIVLAPLSAQSGS